MTLAPARPSWPGLETVPGGVRTAVSASVARARQ